MARSSGVNSAPKSSASKIGRISMSDSLSMGFGQRFTHSTASSIERTCQSQYPAMSSFVSAKGPSITVRLSPLKCTRLPLLLGWRPSPASMMPAFTNWSLYASMSERSFSLGIWPASDSAVALTMTMTRILEPSFWWYRVMVSPKRRTRRRRIDIDGGDTQWGQTRLHDRVWNRLRGLARFNRV